MAKFKVRSRSLTAARCLRRETCARLSAIEASPGQVRRGSSLRRPAVRRASRAAEQPHAERTLRLALGASRARAAAGDDRRQRRQHEHASAIARPASRSPPKWPGPATRRLTYVSTRRRLLSRRIGGLVEDRQSARFRRAGRRLVRHPDAAGNGLHPRRAGPHRRIGRAADPERRPDPRRRRRAASASTARPGRSPSPPTA